MADQVPVPAPAQAPAEVVENVLDPLIQRLPPREQQVVRRAIVQAVSVSYQGPLPPPGMMAEYNESMPNGADRIMKQFEAQTAHRISMESKALDAQIGRVRTGQWMAFTLAVVFGAAGTFLAMNGHPAVAGILFTGTIGSLAVAFLTGRAPPKGAEPEADEDGGDEPAQPPRAPSKQPRLPKKQGKR